MIQIWKPVPLIIIFAAALHASWNAVVKSGEDKLLQMTAVMSGHIPFAVITLFLSLSRFFMLAKFSSWGYFPLWLSGLFGRGI